MATLHWPRCEIARDSSFAALRDIPFVLTESEDYPDGINLYLYERARGKLAAQHKPHNRLILRPLERSSAKVVAHHLVDLLTWAETELAHPSLGCLDWREVKAWHINDLWKEQLLLGYWSENFFRTNKASPLNPLTVRSRVSTALGCYTWMGQQGLIRNFDYEPRMHTVQRAKDSMLISYRREMRETVVNSVPVKRAIRRSPADLPLPSLEHLQRFFEAIPKGSHRLAALLLFETGMRAEELVENTLIPGQTHQRGRDLPLNWRHPAWPDDPYRLKYSLSDNLMLGVLPTIEAAWNEDARQGYQCAYRVLGKNHKLRKVSIPPALLQRIWTYIGSNERQSLAEVRRQRGKPPTAHVFLNRFGDPLSYHAIWESFDAANDLLKAPVRLTPHLLRHAFACYFLEAAILAAAQEKGYDVTRIPHDFVMSAGETALLVLQSELGHAYPATTRRYLTQIASGRLHLAAQTAWNNFLDGIEADHA